jgi:predicted AAA+ superfamily ATPase
MENPGSFYFWEKSQASEIDLVLNSRGITIPIEIKYADSWDKKHIHSIETFKQRHKDKGLKIPFSLIIYDCIFCCPLKFILSLRLHSQWQG